MEESVESLCLFFNAPPVSSVVLRAVSFLGDKETACVGVEDMAGEEDWASLHSCASELVVASLRDCRITIEPGSGALEDASTTPTPTSATFVSTTDFRSASSLRHSTQTEGTKDEKGSGRADVPRKEASRTGTSSDETAVSSSLSTPLPTESTSTPAFMSHSNLSAKKGTTSRAFSHTRLLAQVGGPARVRRARVGPRPTPTRSCISVASSLDSILLSQRIQSFFCYVEKADLALKPGSSMGADKAITREQRPFIGGLSSQTSPLRAEEGVKELLKRKPEF